MTDDPNDLILSESELNGDKKNACQIKEELDRLIAAIQRRVEASERDRERISKARDSAGGFTDMSQLEQQRKRKADL